MKKILELIYIVMIFLIGLIIVILTTLFSRSDGVTPLAECRGGKTRYNKMDCHDMKFIKQGEDTCWRDSSMYIFLIPKESFKLVEDRMYKVPEVQKYAKILRRDEYVDINRCTPGGGDEQEFMEALLKTMGLTYTKNLSRIRDDGPDYVFDIQKISKKNGPIPIVPDRIKSHKLIGMMFHVTYSDQPWLGHVACAVLCSSSHWRLYNNCAKKVYNFHRNLNHSTVADQSRQILQKCMGRTSAVDEVNYVYCLV